MTFIKWTITKVLSLAQDQRERESIAGLKTIPEL